MNANHLVRIEDKGALELDALCAGLNPLDFSARLIFDLSRRMSRRVAAPSFPTRGTEAHAYLEQLIGWMFAELMRMQEGYSAARWLWYLRRLPNELFAGSYNTTIGYDRALAEAVSWFSPGDETSHTEPQISFRVDSAAFRHVCRYVAIIKLFSHLQITSRRVGKGAELDLVNGVPIAVNDPQVDAAIRTYDQRHDQQSDLRSAGLGLADVTAKLEPLETDRGERLFLLQACEPFHMPANVPDHSGRLVEREIRVRNVILTTSLERLVRPYGRANEAAMPSFRSIEPVLVLLALLRAVVSQLPWALSSLLQFGYFFTDERRLEALTKEYFPPALRQLKQLIPELDWNESFSEWRTRVDALAPKVWPLVAGGVYRRLRGGKLLVDVRSASAFLHRQLLVDRTDPVLANVRSEIFELQVQSLVNESVWKPNALLLAIRGKALRHDGRHVSDIDAIGAQGNRLLLISCKSLVYDLEYDKGTYRTVRNSQTTVDDAVKNWKNIVGGIRAKPVGDNFDFGMFSEIVGVVCTPFVVYSSDPETLAFVSGDLRSCIAFGELQHWLEQ
jgi:hypothetical protein